VTTAARRMVSQNACQSMGKSVRQEGKGASGVRGGRLADESRVAVIEA